MAVFNEILVARLNRALQKLLGMKGESPAPALSGEITPVLAIPLTNEWFALEGWLRYGVHAQTAAVGGQFGSFILRNPAGSGVIAVVEKVQVSVTAAGAFIVSIGNLGSLGSDLATLQTPGIMDQRQPNANSVLHFSSGTQAGGLGGATILDTFLGTASVDMILFEGQQLVLPPNWGIGFQDGTAADVFHVAAWWRERPIEESEAKV